MHHKNPAETSSPRLFNEGLIAEATTINGIHSRDDGATNSSDLWNFDDARSEVASRSVSELLQTGSEDQM